MLKKPFVLIVHLMFLCTWDRTSGGILYFSCLWFCHSVPSETSNLANNCWTVSARALIFYLNISCHLWVPLFFYPVSLTLEFDPFFENLTLLITFEQWVLEPWYFTWVSLEVRPFRGYHYFFTLWAWPRSLTHFLKI